MKKLFLTTVAAVAACSAFAQEPDIRMRPGMP